MEQKTHSQKFLRQRKFFMVMPLLVLPFMTLMFWSLGGGKMDHANAQDVKKGFNMQLPGANLKDDKPLDKLSYYEKAASDSLKLEQQIKNDPYYKMPLDTDTITSHFMDTSMSGIKYSGSGKRVNTKTGSGYTDPNEAKVYRKLAQLNEAMNNVAIPQANIDENNTPNRTTNASVNSSDVDRLEQMMNAMNQKNGDDPEMQQLNSMLERILDIQHPDRVQEQIRKASETRKGQVFAVSAKTQPNPVSLLENGGSNYIKSDTGFSFPSQNGFFSLDDVLSDVSQNAIEAVIHETQTLVNGSTVKLRLVNDIYINGVLIPKNNFVFGTTQLNGERLGIKISSIRYRNSLFPVELQVYDIDGMDGIYIPGAITRDVAKESADRSIQGIGYTSLDPSIGAQAASAGIEAAKTLFSKKVKLIKVTVKAGYQVLLHDEKQKQNN